MTIRKIADLPTVCRHPEHNVPSHICLPNGVYEHECPACKATVVFAVNKPTLGVGQTIDLDPAVDLRKWDYQSWAKSMM